MKIPIKLFKIWNKRIKVITIELQTNFSLSLLYKYIILVGTYYNRLKITPFLTFYQNRLHCARPKLKLITHLLLLFHNMCYVHRYIRVYCDHESCETCNYIITFIVIHFHVFSARIGKTECILLSSLEKSRDQTNLNKYYFVHNCVFYVLYGVVFFFPAVLFLLFCRTTYEHVISNALQNKNLTR